MVKVEVKLIQCSDGNDFAEDFGRAVHEGFTVHSSGMSSIRVKGQDWTREQWWAICSKVVPVDAKS